jgi:hypothetical protein
LRHQGGVFYYYGLSILCLPFVPLRQKGGLYVSFGLEMYFFGFIRLDKITSL